MCTRFCRLRDYEFGGQTMKRLLSFTALFALCNLPMIALSAAGWETMPLLDVLRIFFSEPILWVPLAIGNALFLVFLWSTLRSSAERAPSQG